MNEAARPERSPDRWASERNGLPLEETIQLAQRGDVAAFEQIYRLHSRRIYGLCLRMLKNKAEAEDLTQEAFLRVFRTIRSFRGESAFSSWLYRVAVNEVLMRMRKKRIAETSFEETNTADASEDKPRKDFGRRDSQLDATVDRVTIERAVKQLPPGYRSIVILHDVQGYLHEEIAAMLGCSIGNSKSQLHKGRMRLRKLLQPGRALTPEVQLS